MNKIPAVMCWSGGKDSSLALYEVLQKGVYDVKYLFTTLNGKFKRISMHGVREELLDIQANSIGIPLVKMFVAEGTNSEYESKMEEVLLGFKSEGIAHILFGDIFLEDLRKYRENNLSKVGMNAVFPLWKRNTTSLVGDFIAKGFKSITCCVNDAFLNEDHVGVHINNEFIKSLPENIDPCGENGEYHSFCYQGPIFKSILNVKNGEKIYRPLELNFDDATSKTKGFWFCDILLTN